MSQSAVHAIVEGVVQGVGFRYYVYRLAVQLGVTGWTRNRADGTVEIEAEGSRGQLEALLKEVAIGPRSAAVSNVAINWREPNGRFDRFDIRH